MRTTTTLLALAALAAPATAAAGDKPHRPKPAKADCTAKTTGFHARGTYVSSELTQTAGADTERRGDDRYSGDLVVDVVKANHKAATGEQTYTLENARVRLHPRKGTTPAAGDRVKVHGRITRLGKKCDRTGFTPTATVRKVDIKAAKAAKAPKA